MLKSMIRTTLIAAACGASLAAFARAEEPKRVDVPAGDLTVALESLARQSGVELIYETDQVKGLRTGGVIGEMTTQDAMTKLLQGTPLTLKRDESGAMLIAPPTSDQVSSNRKSETTPSGNRRNVQTTSSASEGQGLLRLAQDQSIQKPEPRGKQVPPADTPYARREDESPARLGEVIVTARKRAENILDVPISITVVGAEQIDRRGLVSAQDYLRGMPGVNQLDDAYGQSIVIRGISTNTENQNFLVGTTTATYFGETPTTNSAGTSGGSNIDIKLVDIERIEVLRGPQGTAFGNSSMGGAVRVIPVAPRLDAFEGKVYAGYSVTSGTGGDNYNVQGVGNIPLIKDKFAIRGTIYHYQDSGFLHNRAGSDPAFQAATVVPFGAEAFAIDKEEVGDYNVFGGRVAALFQATDDLRFTLSYLSQKIELDGYPVATSGTYEQTILQVPPEHVIRGEEEGSFDKDIDIVNVMMEYDLGRADLLATYSYTDSGTMWSTSWTGLSLPWPISNAGPSDHREHIGEIRLATKLDSAWNFLAGLYYEDLKDEVTYDYRWYGDPATNLFAPGQVDMGQYPDRRNLEQKAAFGEASWEFFKDFTLTGGVRAYEYDRTFRVDATGAFYGADGVHVNEDDEASGSNFRTNLSYKPNDDALLYMGWSEGFRLGQVTTGVPPGICDPDGDGIIDGTNSTVESTRRVESDEVESYELGGKFALLDRRLAVAVTLFRMDWSDVPVSVNPQADGGCNWNYLANAGQARSEGTELEVSFQIAEPLRVEFGSSYIHARLTKDVPAIGASKGNRLPGSPKWTVNLGAQYDFEIGGYQTFLRADAIHVGPFFNDLLESGEAGDYVKIDASTRITTRNVYVELFVRNLTNEDQFTKIGFTPSSGYPLQPRTIGLQVGYTF